MAEKNKQNRSNEELAMRELIVPELRKRYPDARIIHELPVRYSTNRIDLAAVTPTAIIPVEIKSSRDVHDRLEAQLRAFLPISAKVIVALAPKWNEQLPAKTETRTVKGCGTYSAHIPQYTPVQEIIRSVGRTFIEVWTVDASAGTITVTDEAYWTQRPWLAQMLHMLHVSELYEIAARYRCWTGKRPVHDKLVSACSELMTGKEIVSAVCAALRERSAFAAESDPPLAA